MSGVRRCLSAPGAAGCLAVLLCETPLGISPEKVEFVRLSAPEAAATPSVSATESRHRGVESAAQEVGPQHRLRERGRLAVALPGARIEIEARPLPLARLRGRARSR